MAKRISRSFSIRHERAQPKHEPAHGLDPLAGGLDAAGQGRHRLGLVGKRQVIGANYSRRGVGEDGPACTGVLSVYGGITVRAAFTTGAISAGVFGLFPAICVTSWF